MIIGRFSSPSWNPAEEMTSLKSGRWVSNFLFGERIKAGVPQIDSVPGGSPKGPKELARERAGQKIRGMGSALESLN